MVTSIIRGVCNDIRKEFDNDLDATPQVLLNSLRFCIFFFEIVFVTCINFFFLVD